jgi:hypothetical protein
VCIDFFAFSASERSRNVTKPLPRDGKAFAAVTSPNLAKTLAMWATSHIQKDGNIPGKHCERTHNGRNEREKLREAEEVVVFVY